MAAILFENKFLLTKKLYKQYCKECFKATRKNTKILSMVLSVISVIASVVVYFFFRMPKVSIALLVVAVYFIFAFFWGYLFSEWVNYRSMLREHGSKAIAMVLDFTPVQVNVRVNKTSFSFKYSSITKAYETDDILILILGRKGMIEHGQIIYKNGFKKTDVDSFKKFINDKTKKEIFVTE